MLLALEGGEKDVHEKLLNFLPFPSKPRPVFCLWTSSPPENFPFSTWSLCPSNNRAVPHSQGSPEGYQQPSITPRREVDSPWRGGWGQPPFPEPAALVATLLFSLAQAAGCDACFLLSLQTRGRGPKGMVGFA